LPFGLQDVGQPEQEEGINAEAEATSLKPSIPSSAEISAPAARKEGQTLKILVMLKTPSKGNFSKRTPNRLL